MIAEATVEKATCENCGADVRENTLFCYNCGKKFAEALSSDTEPVAISDEAKNALDDLTARLKLEETESENKLALAAAERKKARVIPKKAKVPVWETDDNRSGMMLFFVSLFIFIMISVIVFMTVYWK